MQRLVGLDTEYGIYVEGAQVTDLVDEARALVGHGPGPWAGPWDYSQEFPLRDLRGFQANQLNTNPEDDRFDKPASQPMSRNEERSDRALPNGARLYQDHGHPEYASPECRSLFDVVAHDKAGERIVQQCADAYRKATNKNVSLFKNNVDFHGMSYGSHENYLMKRDVPFESIQNGMLPFLVSRILYAGSGKVTVEGTFKKTAQYQLSQRADFFTEVCSVDTLHRRPILNTRDEPHMDQNQFRRLHVICGDANLCETAIALKVGTTALVLDLLEVGWQPPVQLRNSVTAIKALSKDMAAPLELENGKTIGGIDLQRVYLNAAQSHFSGRDDETDWILSQWGFVLDQLTHNPTELRDRIDWVAKYEILTEFLEAENLSWGKVDPDWLQSLDLAYHDVHPEHGLHIGLAQAGEVQTLVSESDILNAMAQGPTNTRAFARGYCVKHFHKKIVGITWSRILFEHNGQQVILPLHDVYDEATSRELNELVKQPGALIKALLDKSKL